VLSDTARGREIFQGRLAADEHVIWYGQPKAFLRFDAQDVFLVPFSLLAGGFVVFWESSVIAAMLRGETKSGNGGDLWFGAVIGGAMFLFILYFIFGRFFAKRWLRRRTHYLLTERRAVVFVDIGTGRMLSLDLGQLAAPRKSVAKNGVGTIRLAQESFWTSQNSNTGLDVPNYLSSRQKPPPVFYDVADADRVYELINELRREGRTPSHAHR